jgi:protein-disulfide isomerase
LAVALRSELRIWRLVPLLCSTVLTACNRAPLDARVERLATRVDSLAVAVTAMKAIIERGSAAAAPQTGTVSSAGAATLGTGTAPVTIVEFTDYQCPFCAHHAREILPRLKRDYIDHGKVRYVVRDLPLPMHPWAPRAAQAARCAGLQGGAQYWRFHDVLFTTQDSVSDSSFTPIARQLGLDAGRFSQCLQSDVAANHVKKDLQDAEKVGLRETPSFVIGPTSSTGMVTGKVLRGALPYEQFAAAIDAALRPGPIAASGQHDSP